MAELVSQAVSFTQLREVMEDCTSSSLTLLMWEALPESQSYLPEDHPVEAQALLMQDGPQLQGHQPQGRLLGFLQVSGAWPFSRAAWAVEKAS